MSENNNEAIVSKGVNKSYGVNESFGVSESAGVNGSFGVTRSKGIGSSYGVHGSNGVSWSNGVNGSEGVVGSYGVNKSDETNNSNGVNFSNGVNWSDGVDMSSGVNRSDGINGSYGINESCGINRSYGLLNCSGINNSIFEANKRSIPRIFGKKVHKERFDHVFENIMLLSKGWFPSFHDIKFLYLKSGSDWEKTPIHYTKQLSKKEAWSGMPKELLDYIKSLPEFDADIFFEVTGIDVNAPKTIKIIYEGKEFDIDIDKAKEMGIAK